MLECIAVKECYHGYIRLYPATKNNYNVIAEAIGDSEGLRLEYPVEFDGIGKKFKSKKDFVDHLKVRLEKQDFHFINEDFYEFAWGEIGDFQELPDDVYGF